MADIEPRPSLNDSRKAPPPGTDKLVKWHPSSIPAIKSTMEPPDGRAVIKDIGSSAETIDFAGWGFEHRDKIPLLRLKNFSGDDRLLFSGEILDVDRALATVTPVKRVDLDEQGWCPDGAVSAAAASIDQPGAYPFRCGSAFYFILGARPAEVDKPAGSLVENGLDFSGVVLLNHRRAPGDSKTEDVSNGPYTIELAGAPGREDPDAQLKIIGFGSDDRLVYNGEPITFAPVGDLATEEIALAFDSSLAQAVATLPLSYVLWLAVKDTTIKEAFQTALSDRWQDYLGRNAAPIDLIEISLFDPFMNLAKTTPTADILPLLQNSRLAKPTPQDLALAETFWAQARNVKLSSPMPGLDEDSAWKAVYKTAWQEAGQFPMTWTDIVKAAPDRNLSIDGVKDIARQIQVPDSPVAESRQVVTDVADGGPPLYRPFLKWLDEVLDFDNLPQGNWNRPIITLLADKMQADGLFRLGQAFLVQENSDTEVVAPDGSTVVLKDMVDVAPLLAVKEARTGIADTGSPSGSHPGAVTIQDHIQSRPATAETALVPSTPPSAAETAAVDLVGIKPDQATDVHLPA
jgi:hypothetical protein